MKTIRTMQIVADIKALSLKEWISYAMAIVAFVFGIIICCWGFATPPPGVIDNSVLFIVGQLLIFIGAILGISFHYDGKLNDFQNEIRKQISIPNHHRNEEEDYADQLG